MHENRIISRYCDTSRPVRSPELLVCDLFL